MDRTLKTVAEHIQFATFNEGRITPKDADVIVTRIVQQMKRNNVPFDSSAFYTACGLDEKVAVK